MHLNPNVRKPIHEVFGENLSGLKNMFFIEPLEYLSFCVSNGEEQHRIDR